MSHKRFLIIVLWDDCKGNGFEDITTSCDTLKKSMKFVAGLKCPYDGDRFQVYDREKGELVKKGEIGKSWSNYS